MRSMCESTRPEVKVGRAWWRRRSAPRRWWRWHGASLLVLGPAAASGGDVVAAGAVEAAAAEELRWSTASSTRCAWRWACGGGAPAAMSSPASATRTSGSLLSYIYSKSNHLA
uniref:Uncharacterized protein n=1 Tax=Arundo donax TaxID=35708 RepID=A0A0A9GP10_ARUDO